MGALVDFGGTEQLRVVLDEWDMGCGAWKRWVVVGRQGVLYYELFFCLMTGGSEAFLLFVFLFISLSPVYHDYDSRISDWLKVTFFYPLSTIVCRQFYLFWLPSFISHLGQGGEKARGRGRPRGQNWFKIVAGMYLRFAICVGFSVYCICLACLSMLTVYGSVFYCFNGRKK